MRARERLPAAAAAAIVPVAVFFVYRDALGAYFFDDDFQWLVGTWSFHLSNLVDIVDLTHFYRPVIDLYFAAATPLFQGSPVLFHAASILLHAANGLLLFALARELSGRTAYALMAAIFFVVQPADVDAVAWVGAIGEPLSAGFGCAALVAMQRFRRTAWAWWHRISIAAFVLGMLTHESAVVFLPLLILADWAVTDDPGGGALVSWRARLRRYVPHAVPMVVYLAVNAIVNSRNYVVTEGYYRIGPHVVTNALDYISSLYVGREDALNYAAIGIGVPLLLLRGSRRVRFATLWVVLGLLPFLFFTWGTTSRHAYLAAMGFGLLLADGVLAIDRSLSRYLPAHYRALAVFALATALAVRLGLFAVDNVRSFAARTEVYRSYAAQFRRIHGDLPAGSQVAPDSRLRIDHEHRFVSALIQWEYRDPTLVLLAGGR